MPDTSKLSLFTRAYIEAALWSSTDERDGYYTVCVSKGEVAAFAAKWPCFGAHRALWFQFSKANGDLVDMGDASGMDERGVLALSEDARAYGSQNILA